MLTLGRKAGESVTIYPTGPEGPAIAVMVSSVRHGLVRLAIDAPRDMRIWRAELLPAASTENPGGG